MTNQQRLAILNDSIVTKVDNALSGLTHDWQLTGTFDLSEEVELRFHGFFNSITPLDDDLIGREMAILYNVWLS